MSFYPTFPKPGPVEGSQRPAGAPNNGAMGGRPTSTGAGAGGSPVERMAAEASSAPPFYPSTAPPMVADTVPTAATGVAPTPSGAAPTAAPPSGVTININAGGQPAAPTAETTPTAPTQPAPPSAGGEMWPDLTQPAAPPPPAVFKQQPSVDELAKVPEGAEVQTPYGVGTKKAGAVDRYTLTPAGQEAHKRATLAMRERFGPTPFDGDVDAPFEIPLIPGKWAFNPWAPPGREWIK
jgi:hypothetical protein